MAFGRLIWPLIEPVLNATGHVVAGATLTVYANRTTNLVTLYADEGGLTPIANPQTGANGSNAAGRFFVQTKAFWVAQGVLYTLRVDRPDGTFDKIDDISPQGNEFAGSDVPSGSMSIGSADLNLSNTASFVTTRVTVGVGRCRDSLNAVNMVLAAPLTKRIDQAWSAGALGGARLSGALGASQTWHWFLLMNPTTGAVDVGADASPTAPTLPGGYTLFRRLGATLTDSTNAMREFVQFGDWFKLKVRSTDFASTVNNGGPFLRQISAPNGIKVEAELYFQVAGTANTTAYLSGIFDPDFGVPPAYGVSTQWAQTRNAGFKDTTGSDVRGLTAIVRQFTDTNRQVYTFTSDPAELIALGVLGWRDAR